MPRFPQDLDYGDTPRAHAILNATRLDVTVAAGRLCSPPPTSIVTTTERTFIIRIKNDVAEWVEVARGASAGDLVDVYGRGGRIVGR